MKAYFVTGTDTGVGKTAIAAALLSAAHDQGKSVIGIKAVETGCERSGDFLRASDAAFLWEAQGGTGPEPAWLCRYRYERPASPEAAASSAIKDYPRVDQLCRDWERAGEVAEFGVVEGAGGLLVPISPRLTTCDLILALELPILIVGSAGLGTINHTLLTVEVARQRGIPVTGFILNGWATDEEHAFASENARAISKHGNVPCLGLFPRVRTFDRGHLAGAAKKELQALL